MFNTFSLYSVIVRDDNAPSPPSQPNPITTATAQGISDQQTAVANTALNNPNVVSPLGNVTYTQTGTQKLTNPDGSVSTIPTYTETQTLSPAEQKLFDQQTQLGSQENTIAAGALTNVQGALQQPIAAPTPVQTSVGSQADIATATKAAQDAAYQRMQPALQQQQQQLTSQLASQGIAPGSQAYIQAMQQFGMQQNDAINSSIQTGDTEQAQLYNEALQSAGLNNSGSAQQLQEEIAQQNQPINEVTALASGGQVSMPSFQAFQGGTVAQTPVAQSVYNSANLAEQQYQAQANEAAQENAGLFGLGGAALGALGTAGASLFRYSDPRLKDDHGVVGKIGDLPVHEFNYKGSDSPLRGFMADEVSKVAPEAVKTDKGSGYKVVNYARALAGALKKVA